MGGSYIPKLGDWRFYSDTNAEPIEDDALADENNTPTLADDSAIRLRLEVVETGGANSGTAAIVAEYSVNESDWTAFGAANHWNWANGQATEGDIIDGYLVADSGTELGEYFESSTNTDKVSNGKVWEGDLCIQQTANATGSTTYYFRFTHDSQPWTPDATYGPNTNPSVTTAASVTVHYATGAIAVAIAPVTASQPTAVRFATGSCSVTTSPVTASQPSAVRFATGSAAAAVAPVASSFATRFATGASAAALSVSTPSAPIREGFVTGTCAAALSAVTPAAPIREGFVTGSSALSLVASTPSAPIREKFATGAVTVSAAVTAAAKEIALATSTIWLAISASAAASVVGAGGARLRNRLTRFLLLRKK